MLIPGDARLQIFDCRLKWSRDDLRPSVNSGGRTIENPLSPVLKIQDALILPAVNLTGEDCIENRFDYRPWFFDSGVLGAERSRNLRSKGDIRLPPRTCESPPYPQ